jgi:archaellin
VALASGSTTIDFEKVAITYSNAPSLETLSPISGWQRTSTTTGTWAIISVQNDEGASNNMLQKGKQFIISAHPSTGIPKSTEFTLEVKPSVRGTIVLEQTAPAAINAVNKLY